MTDRERAERAEALCAQMAAALKTIRFCWAGHAEECAYVRSKYRLKCDCDWPKVSNECDAALTAYRTLSPDPVYAIAPNMHHFLAEIRADGLIEGPRYEAVRRFLDKTNRPRGEG